MPDPTSDRVLALIDEELKRLNQRNDLHPSGLFVWGDKRWVQGVYVAREIAAMRLLNIRNAYVADSLVREAESLGLYDA